MRKTCIALIVLAALLSMLTACGKQADDPAGTDGTSTDAITSVSVNGTACRVDVRKNYGGQETGLRFSIFIPESAVQDDTSVTLTLGLGSGWSISEDSNCKVQMDHRLSGGAADEPVQSVQRKAGGDVSGPQQRFSCCGRLSASAVQHALSDRTGHWLCNCKQCRELP